MNWISVDDRLPKNEVQRVLCITTSGLYCVGYYYDSEWWMDSRGDTFENWGYTLTYWMPLPEPPKEKI